MRIYYKRLVHSTNSKASSLLKTMIYELNKDGYTITDRTSNAVEFKYNKWTLGSRTDVFKKIDGGRFYINSEETTIFFSYYISPVIEIIAFCVVIFFSLIQDYHFLFFIVFIAVMFIIRAVIVRSLGIRIMEDILEKGQLLQE